MGDQPEPAPAVLVRPERAHRVVVVGRDRDPARAVRADPVRGGGSFASVIALIYRFRDG